MKRLIYTDEIKDKILTANFANYRKLIFRDFYRKVRKERKDLKNFKFRKHKL